jgi:hypothetical protein
MIFLFYFLFILLYTPCVLDCALRFLMILLLLIKKMVIIDVISSMAHSKSDSVGQLMMDSSVHILGTDVVFIGPSGQRQPY